MDSSPTAELYVQTLGRFRALRRGEAITDKAWGTHRARTVFKLLLTERGRPMVADRLAEAVWPDADAKSAARNLHTAVSELRRVLEPELAKPAESRFILSTEAGYAFDAAGHAIVDVEAFEQHIARARELLGQGELAAAVQAFAHAEALHDGDYLPEDLYADWAMGERERVRNLRISALLDAAGARARLGRYRMAIASCRRVLEMDNCVEEAYRGIMRYAHALGDRAQALRAFEECASTLGRELGVAPMPETTTLAVQIRAGRPLDETSALPAHEPPALPFSLGSMPLCGRSAELGRVLAAAAAGGMLLIEGDSGIGKSALLDAALARLDERGGPRALRAHAHELTQGLPYHAILSAIERARAEGRLDVARAPLWPSVAALLPGADPAAKIEPDRARLFEAMAQCLFATGAPVLALDDAQWADDGSLEFLAYVGPRLAERRLTVLVAARPSPRLAPLLSRANRDVWLQRARLGPLGDADMALMLEQLAPLQAGARVLAPRLHKATGGNPFFAVAVLTRLFETGQLWTDAEGRWQGVSALLAEPVLPVPEEVEALVDGRVQALSQPARQTLSAAAVIDAPIDYGLLREVCGAAYAGAGWSDTAFLDALDELSEARLLKDGGFAHDAYREAVYARIPPPRRQQLHAAVGALIEARAPTDVGRLAHHFGRSADADRAVRYLYEAGERARAVYANTTALGFFEQALAVMRGHERADQWLNDRFRIHMRRADLAYKLALVDVRRSAMQELLALAPKLQDAAQADALVQAAFMLSDMDEHAEVVRITDVLLPRTSAPAQFRQRHNAWRVRGYAMWELGRPREMAECFEQAAAVAHANGMSRWTVSPTIYTGVANSYLARWNEALACARSAEALAREHGDAYLQGLVAETSVEIFEPLGLFDEAEGALQRSETLYAQVQMERTRMGLEYARGQVLLGRGRPADAIERFERVIELSKAQARPVFAALAQVHIGVAALRAASTPANRAAAARALAPGIDALERMGSRLQLTYACAYAALLHVADGDVAAAERALDRGAGAEANKFTPLFESARSQVLLARRRTAQAQAALLAAQSAILSQAASIPDGAVRASFLAHPVNQLIAGLACP